MEVNVLFVVIAFVVGAGLWAVVNSVMLKRKQKRILAEAEEKGEILKKEKLLQAKEKFLQMKSEYDKNVAERNSNLSRNENRVKQREAELNRKMEEIQRKNNELNILKENLNNQLSVVSKKQSEMDKLQAQQIKKLEVVAGLSAEDAKAQLIDSLRDEAKSEALSQIKDVINEAKLTASKEAQKIVIETIQRTATEHAIENTVSVFNLENEEIKGRIIGREGRNIRALESLTGVEIIIDDSPDAIILSGFDPVRREIARLSLH